MRKGSGTAEIVEYDGHRYRRYPNSENRTHRRYFYGTEPRRGFLHRHVWEDANGPIPEDCEIHHINHDTADNRLENLECCTRSAHRRKHPMSEESALEHRKHLARIRELASRWHRSEAGIIW